MVSGPYGLPILTSHMVAYHKTAVTPLLTQRIGGWVTAVFGVSPPTWFQAQMACLCIQPACGSVDN